MISRAPLARFDKNRSRVLREEAMPQKPAIPPRAKSSGSAREKLLDAATELFCREGFNVVGVDAVLARAGTAKSTLYKTFGSKDALVDAVLDREGRLWRDWFIGALDVGTATARDRLERIGPLLGEWFSSARFYGCPFINAVGEHDKADDRMRKQAMAHKKVVHDRIEALLHDAGAADAGALAHQVGLIVDGAIVAALVTRDRSVATAAGATLACVLDANLGKKRAAQRPASPLKTRPTRHPAQDAVAAAR